MPKRTLEERIQNLEDLMAFVISELNRYKDVRKKIEELTRVLDVK